jgi:hypothetical protein
MANLKLVADAMFSNKKDWKNITDSEKESCFFIFNRYFSKKYPELSQLLNLKTIDKVSSMNLWYTFMLNKPYPKWFWSKIEQDKKKSNLDKIDREILIKNTGLKESDIQYLIEHHYSIIKEEISYYKSIIKQNK